MASAPNGIILVTGPTGSGKTTTLYAMLNGLNRPQSKLFTAEDPIEYHLKGVNQIQVKPQIGLDFAAVLRSVLRQDPDIIMVGEIRDLETARIAIQAALTGHLVLSTLHTNSAAASITRLLDMGVEGYLLASCLRVVVAQRLVRLLCPSCKTPEKPSFEIAQRLKLKKDAAVHVARGCIHCNGTGYRGRTVIHEIMEFGAELREGVIRRSSERELEAITRRGGTLTLHDSAMSRVSAGDTSIEEVLRVVAQPGM
jgi:general secretion pathway protein E